MLLLLAVRDDVVLNAAVHFASNHAVIEQILLRPIGAKADDSPGPGARHPRRPHKLVRRGVIDIDPRFGRRYHVKLRSARFYRRRFTPRSAQRPPRRRSS